MLFNHETVFLVRVKSLYSYTFVRGGAELPKVSVPGFFFLRGKGWGKWRARETVGGKNFAHREEPRSTSLESEIQGPVLVSLVEPRGKVPRGTQRVPPGSSEGLVYRGVKK